MTTTICFLRTGTCDKNDKFQLHLSKEGVELAWKASEDLRDHCFEYIFCSPLPYAKTTADIVAENQPLVGREQIILTPELINNPDTKDETRFRESVQELTHYLLKRFKGKRLLLVSHGRIGKIFCSEHVGDEDEGRLAQWANIKRGEYFCREFIDT